MSSLVEGGRVEEPVNLTGLFRFTVRLYQADLGLLTAVGALSSVVAIAAGLLGRMASHGAFFNTTSLGVSFESDELGSHLHVYWAMVGAHLLGVVALAWGSATFVSLLLGHLREGRRPTAGLRAFLSGLPYCLWVAVFTLLFDLLDRLLTLTSSVASGGSPLMLLVSLLLSVVIGVFFIFYVQEIVAAGRTGAAALSGSWRLVRHVGFGRVLGNRILAGICLLPLLVVEMVALNGLGGAPGSALSQLLDGVIVAPLMAAFVTTMYLLARGGRAQVEGVLGPASPDRSQV